MSVKQMTDIVTSDIFGGKEHAMYGDGDPPLEDALDQDEDTGYTGIM